jgi:hypothetical protein
MCRRAQRAGVQLHREALGSEKLRFMNPSHPFSRCDPQQYLAGFCAGSLALNREAAVRTVSFPVPTSCRAAPLRRRPRRRFNVTRDARFHKSAGVRERAAARPRPSRADCGARARRRHDRRRARGCCGDRGAGIGAAAVGVGAAESVRGGGADRRPSRVDEHPPAVLFDLPRLRRLARGRARPPAHRRRPRHGRDRRLPTAAGAREMAAVRTRSNGTYASI